jgi:predicted phosphodiesterase
VGKVKIGIMSDLHMYRERPWDFDPEDGVFYICAGDITEDHMFRHEFVQSHYEHMFAIKGNHDYYDDTFSDAKYHTLLREVNGIKIVGATLWTDLSRNLDWVMYVNGLIDKRYISDLEHNIYCETHEAHKQFLLTSEADIIVSHHCPSYQSVHPKYYGSPCNASFSSNLDDEILSMKNPPKLWIHGHTHDVFDYMLGKTRVICWPRGYRNENVWYNEYKPKIVEI